MSRAQLHDDWMRLGAQGKDYELRVDNTHVFVTMLADKENGPPKRKTYRLDPVYSALIHQAYERGRQNRTLY